MTSGFLRTFVSIIEEKTLNTCSFFLDLNATDYLPISLRPIELFGLFLILFTPFI